MRLRVCMSCRVWPSTRPKPAGRVSHTGLKETWICAELDSSSLHELCRLHGTSQTPFDNTPRVHLLPANVIAICGIQSNGECRLAASFRDNTLRVFRLAATLCEWQRVQHPNSNYWQPITLLALPGGSLIVGSAFGDAPDSKTMKYGIECSAAQPDGSLAPAKRLHATDINFELVGLMPTADGSHTLRIVAYDHPNRALIIYSLKD